MKANHIAYGLPEDQAAYDRQPGDVYIYNPENLPSPDTLTRPIPSEQGLGARALAFDTIIINGMTIEVPYYYTPKEALISDCPKCSPPPKTKRRQRTARS